jgi:dihydropteroate synthase
MSEKASGTKDPLGRREDGRPLVMGVLNVTPDSFSDGGQHLDPAAALLRAAEMVAEGADIIDVGGESTRPGAESVPLQQELDRVIPVIEAIRRELLVTVSLDTSKPEVMQAGCAAGAGLINDVRALRMPGALEVAASLNCPVCLMHMQGEPRSMQERPAYDDVVSEVAGFLAGRADAARAAGIAERHILLDPGFGFGKTLAHNLELLAGLDQIAALGYPVLAGLSRKSMLGKLLGRELPERLPGSLALALLAAQRGAAILRVHDVAPTVDALRVLSAVEAAADDGSNG